MLLAGDGGRLKDPCSSRRARPEGVWRKVGRGLVGGGELVMGLSGRG